MHIELKILNKELYKQPFNPSMGSFTPGIEKFDLPAYVTPGSAALDLRVTEDVTIYPQERKMLPTGLAFWIGSDSNYSLDYHPLRSNGLPGSYLKEEIGVCGLIIPRSGLGTKGLVLANTIGLIDSDYQGELKISAWNSNEAIEKTLGDDGVYRDHDHPIKLKAGDRVAQLLIIPYIKAQWDLVNEFSAKTDRGQGGFNSTGS